MKCKPKLILILFLAVCRLSVLSAQDNYEIQVYGSQLTQTGTTMLELHSNYAVHGLPAESPGGVPSNHSLRETIEITTGINSFMEIGFYIFSNIHDTKGLQWVGDHIRPRFTAPAQWKLPVGLSLSLEGGYQRKEYAPDIYTLEIRPIIDKMMGKVYLSLNPTLDMAFKGPDAGHGLIFSPNVKASYTLSSFMSLGAEYYGGLGEAGAILPYKLQQHMIVPCIDLNFSPKWEFNFGIGFGLTRTTEPLVIKWILGRRLQLKKTTSL